MKKINYLFWWKDTLFIKNWSDKAVNWLKLEELTTIFKLGIVSKWTNNKYLNLPLNNQKTRSKSPKKNSIYFQIQFYRFIVKSLQFKNIKLSKNYLTFDYINRLWFKFWQDEFFKIRKKRLLVKKISYKNRTVINFPILKYKFVIRNFKQVNKKKQKLLNGFNLGFFFYEYIIEKQNISKLNKKLFQKKTGRYFILKKKITNNENLNIMNNINNKY